MAAWNEQYYSNKLQVKQLIPLFLNVISCDVSAHSCLCVVVFFVAAVSPSANSYNETLSTLRYAAHARNIVNKPRVNEVSSCLKSDAKI